MNALYRNLTQLRALLNEGTDAKTGIWGSQEVSRSAQAAQYGLIGTLLLIAAIVIVPQKDYEANWFAATVGAIALASLLPGEVLAWRTRRKHGASVDASIFIGWTLSTLVLGLPLGHLVERLMVQTHPIQGSPTQLTWAPEALLAIYIALYGWRFVQARQWQARLDSERLRRETAEQGQALAQAQLKMLQAQIEPHFLFNTLASVQQLVRKDALQADYMLGQLIRYLREATPQIQGMGSNLGREFGLIGAYLNICKVRMGSRLRTDISLPTELACVSFPPLIIQTLVENAIKHGVEPQSGAATITVVARVIQHRGQNCIQVSVEDDGVGFGVADTVGTGVGLRNVRDRLAGLYAGQAALGITSNTPHGVRATVTFPWSEA